MDPLALGSLGALAISAYSLILARRKAPLDNRKTSAEASLAELNLVDEFRGELETTRKEMSGLRERLLQAEADRAVAEAELAKELARASKERHDLKEQIYIRDGHISVLQQKVRDLGDLVETLRAQIDEARHGRRYDDPQHM